MEQVWKNVEIKELPLCQGWPKSKLLLCTLWKAYIYRSETFRKEFGKFFRLYSELLSKFGDISFQEYVLKGISYPVFYDDLVNENKESHGTKLFSEQL